MRTLVNNSSVKSHETVGYTYGDNCRFTIRRFEDHEHNVVWALYDAEAGTVWPAPIVAVFDSEEKAKKAADDASK